MPAFYGVGHAEFLRQRNIAFFSFYWLLAALLFIWVFYYRQKGFPQSFTNETIPNFNLVFISLFLISILGTGNLNNITSIAATRAIMNGSAQGYRAERDQWIKDIENSNGTTPVVHYLQHKVDVIDLWGVFELYPDWVLGCMADYYGIDAILLENGDEATLIPSWKNSKH